MLQDTDSRDANVKNADSSDANMPEIVLYVETPRSSDNHPPLDIFNVEQKVYIFGKIDNYHLQHKNGWCRTLRSAWFASCIVVLLIGFL